MCGVSGLAAPKSSANSSRSGSPHTGSFIPQPKAAVITRDRNTSDRSRHSLKTTQQQQRTQLCQE
ncbi:hypothetical protein IscW_ISCW011958 [Ixodes scapularis]|uniref:Uncharacterized protein n=1 Tax=Ixodes scapularis TaxID=6945 RepID=B7QF28_IXOSC|nr:hypothetical protein IscW_ISCW011958 [Ixodes scapularis]|eukprot:XP_002414142.1 hypothetical protein IscW_ISCW011958 [Ixodes scapularis]